MKLPNPYETVIAILQDDKEIEAYVYPDGSWSNNIKPVNWKSVDEVTHDVFFGENIKRVTK